MALPDPENKGAANFVLKKSQEKLTKLDSPLAGKGDLEPKENITITLEPHIGEPGFYWAEHQLTGERSVVQIPKHEDPAILKTFEGVIRDKNSLDRWRDNFEILGPIEEPKSAAVEYEERNDYGMF